MKLTKKEKLFCLYYAQCRNGKEAAVNAGYHSPLETSVRLLERAEIRQAVTENAKKSAVDPNEIAAGYRKLAFGSGADALKLLFCSDPSSLSLDALDLFNVSEIKKPKDGALEIKFFDRLKALEHLESLSVSAGDTSAGQFYEALMHAVPQSDEDT